MTILHSPSYLRALLLFLFVCLIFVPGSMAQGNRPIPTPPVKPPSSENQPTGPNPRTQGQANAELNVLMSSRNWELSSEREKRRLDNQLAQDLQRIQELESNAISPVASSTTPDYRALARAASEIRDRAIRIKFNTPLLLKIQNPEKFQYEEDAGKLKAMVPELSRFIKSFLDNPVFRVNSPSDSDLRSRAGKDLERIIKLSKTINKIARKLTKDQST